MAELGFFRRHPWRTHALGITVWGASFGAIWIMGGLRTAVIVASVSLAVAAVMFVIASGRR
jgi:hypothetical protein